MIQYIVWTMCTVYICCSHYKNDHIAFQHSLCMTIRILGQHILSHIFCILYMSVSSDSIPAHFPRGLAPTHIHTYIYKHFEYWSHHNAYGRRVYIASLDTPRGRHLAQVVRIIRCLLQAFDMKMSPRR